MLDNISTMKFSIEKESIERTTDATSNHSGYQSFRSSIDSTTKKCLFPRAIEPLSRFQRISVTNKIQILFARCSRRWFCSEKSLSGHAYSITTRGLYACCSRCTHVLRMFRLNNRLNESFNRCSREERIERTRDLHTLEERQ